MGVVQGVSEDGEEIVLRLNLPGVIQPPTVVLYPEDNEWDCDCDSRSDDCAHVAAAVISMKHARESGDGLPRSAMGNTQIEYRFTRHPNGLHLKRVLILDDDREELLKTPLMAGVEKRTFAFGFHPSSVDLTVDRLVGRSLNRPAPMNPRVLRQVLAALRGSTNLRLDGQPVSVHEDPLNPEATVENHSETAIALNVTSCSDLPEILAPGVGLVGDCIHELGECELGGPLWEKLPISITYEKKGFAELVASAIPELQKRIDVDVYTERLPETLRFMQPRLTLSTDHSNRSVSVLPELVYGNPPNVKIVDDKMVFLEGGVPVRDRRAERQLIDRLRDDLNLVTNRRVAVTGKEATYFLERIQVFSEAYLGSSQQILTNVDPLTPLIVVKDDVFSVTFVLESDDPTPGAAGRQRFADPNNVLGAWREGLTMAPLEGGGWAPIPREWLTRYGFLVQDILAARSSDNKVSPAAIPMLSKLCKALDLPHQPCFDRLRPLLEGFESIPEAPLPEDLTAVLRTYQQQGVNWLAFLSSAGLGGILADDMGLGKTVQALTAVSGRTLVVAPTSVLDNWAAEAKRFRPSLKVCMFHGPKRTIDTTADIVLTTYALLRIDLPKLMKPKWAMVVLDEAQNIKNPNSQVAQAAFKLKGEFHLAMSGTPVENRLEELWSLFHFCNRGLLGSRSSFQKGFADPIGLGEKDATNRLRERITPFVLRRMKQEVAPELPPRIEQVLHCELEAEERHVYDAIRAATSKSVVKKLSKGSSVMAALEALLRLRQCACHVSLVPGHKATISAKLTLLLERLEVTVANGHKALVFSQWTSLLDLVEPALAKAGIEFVRLDGTTRNRGQVVERFQSKDGPPAMLISLKAGGTGLNLTEADHVFLLDPWWNPAVEDQAADRTHRIGQTKPVMVYRLVARETVEERIMKLQEKKRRLADAALGVADRALSLTKEDLLFLLE
jgi:superfamily II DNA or RNA helicase